MMISLHPLPLTVLKLLLVYQTSASPLPSLHNELQKRSSGSPDGNIDVTDGASLDKRWKVMPAWGKRGDAPAYPRWQSDQSDDFVPEKKWNTMAAWGKRNGITVKADKKWGTMGAWGKRGGDEINADKKWNNMPAWGKRDSQSAEKKWKLLEAWGKRNANLDKKWNEIIGWGKRGNEPVSLSQSNADEAIAAFTKLVHKRARTNLPIWKQMLNNRDQAWKRRSWETASQFWGRR